MKTLPVKTLPVKTLPVKTLPVKTLPVKTLPVKTLPHIFLSLFYFYIRFIALCINSFKCERITEKAKQKSIMK